VFLTHINMMTGLEHSVAATPQSLFQQLFLQLPEHMRGVEVVNEAGKVDRAWIDMYPGAPCSTATTFLYGVTTQASDRNPSPQRAWKASLAHRLCPCQTNACSVRRRLAA